MNHAADTSTTCRRLAVAVRGKQQFEAAPSHPPAPTATASRRHGFLRAARALALGTGLSLVTAATFAAEPVRLADTSGRFHEPLKPAAARKATVVIFTLPDCPIANAFAPEINRLFADYSAKGVAFFLAHADRDLTAAAARQHATEFAFRCPVLLDVQHALVTALGATKTPQAFLLDTTGQPVYRGRINNLFADYGTRRQAVTQHDLRNALDAVLASKPVAQPVTEAIGCHIQTRPAKSP